MMSLHEAVPEVFFLITTHHFQTRHQIINGKPNKHLFERRKIASGLVEKSTHRDRKIRWLRSAKSTSFDFKTLSRLARTRSLPSSPICRSSGNVRCVATGDESSACRFEILHAVCRYSITSLRLN
jgi:hypothetical protein